LSRWQFGQPVPITPTFNISYLLDHDPLKTLPAASSALQFSCEAYGKYAILKSLNIAEEAWK
jgi:hypothetical protein